MRKSDILATLTVVMFGLLAGAGCHHHYILSRQQDKPWSIVSETVVPYEPPAVPIDTPEEIEEEIYYDSLELLAMCAEAEAGNQDLLGKRLVVDVILNRVDDPDWPDTIEGVITDPYEFTTWWNGMVEAAIPSEETYLAVQMELKERSYPGLFYFSSEGYSAYGNPWKKVGDHYFSTK